MIREPGDAVVHIILPALDGSPFDLDSLKGRPFMLSFFRFASCPFCNLRMHELVTRFDELPKDFTIVAVFDSPLDNLQRHADKHQAPFPVLADADNRHYKLYGIKHSVIGVLKGMLFRMPRMLYGMFVKGYLPLSIKGSMTTMPADFLIDKNGIIQRAYYGKDEGDHLPFEQVKAFSLTQETPDMASSQHAIVSNSYQTIDVKEAL
jgi:peroxiredoxin Q/BCP